MKNLLQYKIVFFIFFLFFVQFNSQDTKIDDLNNETIEKKIDSLHNNPNKAWEIINLYIKKSKKEKNDESLLYAYRYAGNFSQYPENLKYADSALAIGKKSNNKKLLTEAYLNRGFVFMSQSLYQKALDDILIANKYSNELNDSYTVNCNKYLIAQNKIYLGLYEEANKELSSCIEYFKKNLTKTSDLGKNYQMFYLYSLMSLIDTNTKLRRHEENNVLLKTAFEYIKQNNLKQYTPYFISCDGVDDYFKKNYKPAIKKLSEAIRLYNDQWPHITDIFYIGLSNWKLGKRDVAVKYFEEIDKEYDKSKKLNPEFRPAYELLIKYNDSIGNRDKQLKYINTLMSLDKNYEKNYKYLFSKINKEYDTHKLINEKNKIESSLKNQRTIISSILLITILASLFYWNRYNSLQKKYKEKFEEIISQKPILEKIETLAEVESKQEDDLNLKTLNITDKIKITAPKNSSELEFYNKIPGLNPILVQNILQQLEKFEEELRFTDNQMSLRLLSEEFNTNIPYLSKIINVYKGKNFNYYINDLRIDYIIELLKNDATYLNYDIKNLASLAGFTNAVNFSDNFQRKFEIKPSYFIKMMKENIKTNS
ncbi:helix-turn-helix domain-containing protein [Cloacibacterium sp. TD35]|uniref:helix-turn-helix domain-containing protein n=1 Tax=Cloacibacterium sp. TD35 TaxID=2976818 RepID=UPI00237E5498|nr:AraC family transcriptional regulator [Cloacibacterium sp. TD35]WDT67540.1 AraC family transcriptional regulator [Cloacibacterium sp. TD35]